MMTSSEIFATVQQLSSQINESRIKHVVETINSLSIDDVQQIVDVLSIALEKHHHLLVHADRVLNLLTEIASSTNLVARNRILNTDMIAAGSSPDVYTVRDELPASVRVIKKATPGAFSKELMNWAHISHPNILPVYGAFLDGAGGPAYLVSLVFIQRNIIDHTKSLLQAQRMPLISDVIDGLCYLHQLNVVHGSINPESVLILEDGRVSLTDLDGSSHTSAIRYCAPEILENEDTVATKSADVWALGCLCYEVFSGNVPYYHHRQEKVVAAVLARKQPTRPGQQGVKGEEIDDATWQPVSACWEFDPEDRPSCSALRDAFSGVNVYDDRPILQPSSALRQVEAPAIDLGSIRSLLHQVFGSDQLPPPPSQIPDQLREPLIGLADSLPRAYSMAAAAKTLNPGDIQTLLNALDLLVVENPSFVMGWNPVFQLMNTLMGSTRIFPQHYKLHRIQYDPSPIAEDSFGKVYKASDLDVCVNVVTDPTDIVNITKSLAVWAHLSHPNLLPFYGVFSEVVNEIPQLCVVSPFMKNGTLLEYAPRLPQKSRIPLILNVLDVLRYFFDHNRNQDIIRPDLILISDDGQALVTLPHASSIVTCTPVAKTIRSSASRAIRFRAPECSKGQQSSSRSDIWTFGCLCYEVLSGKPPYHQYKSRTEIESALARGERPERPSNTDDGIEIIDDIWWELIMGCCEVKPQDRLTVAEIQKQLENLRSPNERRNPNIHKLPGIAVRSLRKRPDIEWNRVKQLLGQLQVEPLRAPLSKLLQNRIEDMVAEAMNFDPSDVQTLVDFLDLTLKDHLTISEDRNRVLALLSKVMTSARVFPRRHEIKGVKYNPRPIAEGGFGKVHRGTSNAALCVKVTTRVNDPLALVVYIRELVLWAHCSHPNVLPFYGVFFDDFQQICLVSPFMEKGNLTYYANQLPQSSRIPLLLDTIMGLDYLHGLGIVHTDLKGENVLISDEGRGLITDFGASHIVTATAKGAVTTASVVTTLRFTAPEIIQNRDSRVRPNKESDIWSFGCLCYQVLSRKLPYYELKLDAQVIAALIRGRLPKQPGPTKGNTDGFSDNGWSDFDKKDWDDLNDVIWSLIMKCLILNPENRPNASQIRELIVNMKAWDHQPAAKDVPDTRIFKQRPNVNLNLNRAGVLLDHLQILFLARSIYKHSVQDIVAAVSRLNEEDATDLENFFASALNTHLSATSDRSRILAISSAVIASRLHVPLGYGFKTWPQYHLEVFGEGSFGKVYRESKLNICVKVALQRQVFSGFKRQWQKALAPWAHSSHPSILPFYGMELLRGKLILVSPFVENGNIYDHALHLSKNSRLLLISDVIQGLVYLHNLGIIHGNLKAQNILISNEGRALITDFRPYHINVAAAVTGPTGSFITSTLRFTAPELVQNSQMLPTTASDVWAKFTKVLSRRVPYYQYSEDPEIRAALSRDELLIRPILSDGITDEIDDKSWDLIKQCCAPKPRGRPKLGDIRKWLRNMDLEDIRPVTKTLPSAEIMKERESYQKIHVNRLEEVLDKLKIHLSQPTHPSPATHAEGKSRRPMNMRIGSFLSKIPQTATLLTFRRRK